MCGVLILPLDKRLTPGLLDCSANALTNSNYHLLLGSAKAAVQRGGRSLGGVWFCFSGGYSNVSAPERRPVGTLGAGWVIAGIELGLCFTNACN